MHGLYISDEYEASQANPKSGVGKKIQSQIKTLNDAGIDCHNMCVRRKEATVWSKLRARLWFLGDGLNWEITDEVRGADFLYIRRPTTILGSFIRFLKKVKAENPKCKILMEIPTYPYDREMEAVWHRRPLLWQDRYYRKKLSRYLDRIVVLSDDSMVFGVPTLKIQNGVDLSSYRVKKQNETDVLNIGCAAQFSFWHGIDRVLQGVAEYVQKPGKKTEVHLYLAGEGPQLPVLKQQTQELHLENMVTFLGRLNQEELYRKVFDRCDLGLECLGNHRHIADPISSSLKSREYLAVGLPAIFAGRLDILEKEPADFFLQVESNDSSVNIGEIILFYQNLLKNETKAQLSTRIRAYAERHIGWEKTFASVIDWLKQQCSEV